jgi:hypothetical protein
LKQGLLCVADSKTPWGASTSRDHHTPSLLTPSPRWKGRNQLTKLTRSDQWEYRLPPQASMATRLRLSLLCEAMDRRVEFIADIH